MNTATEFDTEFDRGIEKIPFEFRTYCWNKALSASSRDEDENWKHFKEAIMQARFGGVSSEAEAFRLYIAEQIGNQHFFPAEESPQELAIKLSEEIQEAFQHISRPVSTASEQENIIIEIINYYFPSEEKIHNFELTLNGAFDKDVDGDFDIIDKEPVKTQTENKVQTQFPVNEKPSKAEEEFSFEDDLEEEPPKLSFGESVAQSFSQSASQSITKVFSLGAKAEAKTSPEAERPKVLDYIKQRDSGSAISALGMSKTVRRIIDDFYPPVC
ncbi:MAG: hypothetical protein SFU25_08330 [Candidatus Caenarcaniphilales bacterium]|nr:hypothetical protein [Candidatus Caenarcaniphilales bacterium]